MIWFHDMSTLDSFNGLGKYLNAEKSKLRQPSMHLALIMTTAIKFVVQFCTQTKNNFISKGIKFLMVSKVQLI